MLDNLTEKFFVGRKRKKKNVSAREYHIPCMDEQGQWWYGYEKIQIVKHPEWSKELWRKKNSLDGEK